MLIQVTYPGLYIETAEKSAAATTKSKVPADATSTKKVARPTSGKLASDDLNAVIVGNSGGHSG